MERKGVHSSKQSSLSNSSPQQSRYANHFTTNQTVKFFKHQVRLPINLIRAAVTLVEAMRETGAQNYLPYCFHYLYCFVVCVLHNKTTKWKTLLLHLTMHALVVGKFKIRWCLLSTCMHTAWWQRWYTYAYL